MINDRVSKLLYIVDISSYKKEQLKLHRSFLGVKAGGGGGGSGVAKVSGARGKLEFCAPPSKKFLKNDNKMSSIQLII